MESIQQHMTCSHTDNSQWSVVRVAASHFHHISVRQVLAFPVTSHQVWVAPTHKPMSVRMNSWKLHTSTIWKMPFTGSLAQVQCKLVHPSRSHICVAQPHVTHKAHVKLGAQADSTEGDFITVLFCCAEVEDLRIWIRIIRHQACSCKDLSACITRKSHYSLVRLWWQNFRCFSHCDHLHQWMLANQTLLYICTV